MEKGEEGIENWSERVEDLVDAGEVDTAISLLESVVETLTPIPDRSSQLQLASALSDLANLYSSKGFPLKAYDLQSRASFITQLQHSHSIDAGAVNEFNEEDAGAIPPPTNVASSSSKDPISDDGAPSHGYTGKQPQLPAQSDDDWEAIADREPDELLPMASSDCLSGVSNLKLEDTKRQTPKRRGRGTFSYDKDKLYSDQILDGSIVEVEDEEAHSASEDKNDIHNLKYGTSHVLVLADLSLSTRTTDLEKLFEDFKDRGFVIRWVNDTVALAVFRTPSVALEARNSTRCSFTVRILDEDDVLLSSIKPSDLEPPRQRPQTSIDAATRLIAQGMGIKLSPHRSGSPREHKKQEDARKERITTRQKLRDEAWGED